MAADRWNRKFLMFLVTGIWGIWTVLAGFAQDQTQLLLLYTIGSIGTIAAEPLTASITADLFPAQERGKAFGALRAIGGIGFVVLAPIAAVLTQSPDGWRWALFLLGGMSMLAGVVILLVFEDPGRGASDPDFEHSERLNRDDLKVLLRRRTIWFLAFSLLFTTSPVLVSFAVTYLVDVRGFTNAEGTYVLAMFIIGYIISSMLGGLLGDKAQKLWGVNGRIGLMQVYLVVFAAMSYICLQLPLPHWSFYPMFLLFGILSSIGHPGAVMPIITLVVPANVRSTAFGFLFSFVQGAITAVLSIAVGWLGQSQGLPLAVFWLTTVPYLFNAVLWTLAYRIVPREVINSRSS